MQRFRSFVVLCAVCAVPSFAQDAVKVAPDMAKVKVDNEHVRVVEFTIKPGAKDVTHSHPAGWYYVTQGGTLKVTAADGKVETWNAKTGEAAWMEAEGAHVSQNVGKTTLVFTLVEVKSAGK